MTFISLFVYFQYSITLLHYFIFTCSVTFVQFLVVGATASVSNVFCWLLVNNGDFDFTVMLM